MVSSLSRRTSKSRTTLEGVTVSVPTCSLRFVFSRRFSMARVPNQIISDFDGFSWTRFAEHQAWTSSTQCSMFEIMLCYVTLRYITLRYVALHYVTLRYVTLRYVMLYYAMLCYAVLRCQIMLRYVMLHYFMLFYAMLFCAVLCKNYVMLCYIKSINFMCFGKIKNHVFAGRFRTLDTQISV